MVLDYGCQYTVWRVFYQDDYNAWMAQQAKQASTPVGVAPVSKPASVPKAASSPASTTPAAPSAPVAPAAPVAPQQ